MKVIAPTAVLFLICALGVGSVQAASITLSIGIRETTSSSGPAFSNAGSSGGIEWVNKDGQSLTADGTWQLFTFTPSTDTLAAFAGASANGVLDTDWAALEHVRILNSDGIIDPIRIWIDNVTNTDSAGSVVEGFEGFATGVEAIFQEPSFSGSTSANVVLVPASSSLVSNSMAYAGAQSDEVKFQFVDNNPTRWVRLTTFNTPNLPNPAMHVREAGFNPTISFYAKAVVVPEPCSAALVGLACLGMLLASRRVG